MIFEFEYSLLKAFYEIVFVRKSHDKIDKVANFWMIYRLGRIYILENLQNKNGE